MVGETSCSLPVSWGRWAGIPFWKKQAHFSEVGLHQASTHNRANCIHIPIPEDHHWFGWFFAICIIFNIYTPPSILHSDNGGEFIADVVRNLCDRCDVRIVNGGPERNSKRWIDELPKIVRSYNHTVHEITNRTPFEALHGWKPSTIKQWFSDRVQSRKRPKSSQ